MFGTKSLKQIVSTFDNIVTELDVFIAKTEARVDIAHEVVDEAQFDIDKGIDNIRKAKKIKGNIKEIIS